MIPRRGIETTIEERLARLRRRLSLSRTMDSALVVLSEVDLPTLRELESQLGGFHRIRDPELLREYLARACVARNRGARQMLDTSVVTDEMVKSWASGVLVEWMDGYTDYQEAWGGQYQIRYLGTAELNGDIPGLLYEISTVQGRDPRRFHITISAVEVVQLGAR